MNPNPPIDSSDPSGGQRPIRKIDQAFEEVARLSGSDAPPAQFFQDFLEKTLSGIDAPAGAVWLKNVQGFLQLQCQVNIDGVGLDKHKNGRQSHNELLRQAFQTAKPILLEPFGSTGILEGIPAGNPTDFVVLLAPIMLDEKTAVGLVEVWQEPRWDARVKRVHLNYLVQMAGYASNFVKNQQSRQTTNQEQLWTQLEAFTCSLHASLDPTIVSYHAANEGRRLIGCDRVSVAVREGKKAKIEAVSGADVVEKRSSQIQLMRKLADSVFKWNEKLVYRGIKDDGLPPDVYHALDEYLAQSPAKLLVFQPLHDQREYDKETKEVKPNRARSALLMECFEPPSQPEPLIARLDIIGRHAASALYNATEMRKIPLGLLWKPILKLQEGLGGRAKFYTYLITAVVVVVLVAMLIPGTWELKMDAKGTMLPAERVPIYSPRAAKVERILVEKGTPIKNGQVMIELQDNDLQTQMNRAQTDLEQAKSREMLLRSMLTKPSAPAEYSKTQLDHMQAQMEIIAAAAQVDLLRRQANADLTRPGRLTLVAPLFDPTRRHTTEPHWEVLNGNDIVNDLLGRNIRPNEQLLRIGETTGEWEIEVKIPQKHMAKILDAFQQNGDQDLDVELKLSSEPTESYRGKLARKRVAPAVIPNRDDHNETEPVCYAYVRITGDDIPEKQQIPRHLYLTGIEVSTNVRCGKHSAGYSLFYGLVEFVHQKIFQFL